MSEELSLRDIRLQKLARMRELGHDPFAIEKFERTGTAMWLLENFDELSLPLTSEAGEGAGGRGLQISFAGRVVSYRDMGKAGFAHLSDGDGKVQVYCRKDELTPPSNPLPTSGKEGEPDGWQLFQLLDIGDHVGVEGFMFLTKTGEKSIHVTKLIPLTKCLEPLPLGKEKDGQHWYGLADVEQRYRHRHLDLLTNQEARKALIDRARIVSAVRRYFDGAGYLEVETPLLQVVAGGAAARPFKTHYNHYDMEVKLRISLELYLKRLICGDIPAVYEIGRVFRNEGVSNRHNPEFTLLEFYEAYTDLEGMMRRVEECFAFVVKTVYGSEEAFHLHQFLYSHGLTALPGKRLIVIDSLVFLELNSQYPGTSRRAWQRGVKFKRGWLDAEGDSIPEEVADLEFTYMLTDGVVDIYEDNVEYFVFTVISPAAEISVSRPNGGCETTIALAAGTYALPSRLAQCPLLSFSKPWRRVDLLDEIARLSGLDRSDLLDLAGAKAAILAKGVIEKAHELGDHIDLAKEDNLGGLIEKLLEVFVEPTLQEPTFVVGYPIETSPLAKKDPNNPRMTRRFEGYILGREICNAFSEINDPIDQRERFEQQGQELAKGDDEAHPYDHEFLYALECGMPPTGGCGIGMERLAMVLTGCEHIREIMFFPMMKPEEPKP